MLFQVHVATLRRSVTRLYLRFESRTMSNDWEDQEGSISDPHSAREEDEGSQTTAAGQQASGSDPPGNKKSRTERSWLPENWWKPSLFHSKSQPSGRDAKYYKSLSLQDKRALYTCGRKFVTMSSIDPWSEQCRKAPKKKLFSRLKPSREIVENEELNKKVSWWKGDITCLEIDAIVNAANRSLLGGGGVDGAIHSAAGYSLRDECAELNGCDTGDAKITSGHRLPAKYIIHTVGPVNCNREMLKSCYDRCLQLVLKEDIKSVAFCCIATGVYGYPNEEAARVALSTIREWLETADNASQVDRIIFCVFLNTDVQIYHNLLYEYFPPVGNRNTESHEEESEGTTSMDIDEAAGSSGDKSAKPVLTRSLTEPATHASGASQPVDDVHSADPETRAESLKDSSNKNSDAGKKTHAVPPQPHYSDIVPAEPKGTAAEDTENVRNGHPSETRTEISDPQSPPSETGDIQAEDDKRDTEDMAAVRSGSEESPPHKDNSDAEGTV